MRPFTRVVLFSSICLLADCSGKRMETVNTTLIQMSRTDVLACTGVPAKTLVIDTTTTIDEWDYDENKVSNSLSLGTISSIFAPILAFPSMLMSGDQMSFSGDGNCKAIATFKNNTLTSLHYGGDNTTMFTGHAGVCEPIFRGCLK